MASGILEETKKSCSHKYSFGEYAETNYLRMEGFNLKNKTKS